MEIIKETFDKEHAWVIDKMSEHLIEVNKRFLSERRSAMARYDEADGIFFGRYAQWAFMTFFYIGIFSTGAIIIAIIGRCCGWF